MAGPGKDLKRGRALAVLHILRQATKGIPPINSLARLALARVTLFSLPGCSVIGRVVAGQGVHTDAAIDTDAGYQHFGQQSAREG